MWGASRADRGLFVQPFSVDGEGGGSRIMRTLLDSAPSEVVNVMTSPSEPPATDRAAIHLPSRPLVPLLEGTRLGAPMETVDGLCLSRLERRLKTVADTQGATFVHSVAHGTEFWAAYRVAMKLELPFFLTVHDDVRSSVRYRLDRALVMRRLREAWRKAAHRFVISDCMGEEYCARYGRRAYDVVTDGLASIQSRPRYREAGRLRVYFMGSFHWGYRPNVAALSQALTDWRARRGGEVSLVFRGGGPPPEDYHGISGEVRPYGPTSAIEADLDEVDALYLPLPFGRSYRDFVRLSMSTKLVTYLGTGLPILYHGPKEAAAASLLRKSNAAACAYADDELGASLDHLVGSRDALAARALNLAQDQFDVDRVRRRFWDAIDGSLSKDSSESARIAGVAEDHRLGGVS